MSRGGRFGLYAVGREVYVNGRLGTITATLPDGIVQVQFSDGTETNVSTAYGPITPRI